MLGKDADYEAGHGTRGSRLDTVRLMTKIVDAREGRKGEASRTVSLTLAKRKEGAKGESLQ